MGNPLTFFFDWLTGRDVEKRRARVRREPLPAAWQAYLFDDVAFYQHLDEDLRQRLEERLKVFIAEKNFEGAAGFEVTDQARVVISAAAARLIVHLHDSYYDRLRDIVIYPNTMTLPSHPYANDDSMHALGVALDGTTVVLSWEATLQGLRNPSDGQDTASHEFAHILDRAQGGTNGTPPLESAEAYRAWAQVVEGHYELHRDYCPNLDRVLEHYARTNKVEFFAVATEVFFEQPRKMRTLAPDLFDQFSAFYGFVPDDLAGVPSGRRIGRNDPCRCGSKKKYKRCCGRKHP